MQYDTTQVIPTSARATYIEALDVFEQYVRWWVDELWKQIDQMQQRCASIVLIILLVAQSREGLAWR
jgi:hypothetical protein